MKCRNIRKKLLEYIDNTLSYKDFLLVDKHIAECDSCLREIGLLNKLSGAIHKVDYPPVSVWENFLSDLHARIDRESAKNFAEEQKRQYYITWGWVSAAVVAVIFLIASIMLEYRLDDTRDRLMPQAKLASESIEIENPESYIIADVVSKALINDKRIKELKKIQKINEYSGIFNSPTYEYYSITSEILTQPRTDSEDSVQPSFYDSLKDFDYMDTTEYYVSGSGSI